MTRDPDYVTHACTTNTAGGGYTAYDWVTRGLGGTVRVSAITSEVTVQVETKPYDGGVYAPAHLLKPQVRDLIAALQAALEHTPE